MELPEKRKGVEKDEGEPRKSLYFLIKDFCDYTSAHGFGRINASTHWSRTLFWSLLFIAAVTVMTVQLHTLYKKYKSRPLTTLVEVETSTSLPFPTVTFCNFNAIRNDSLQAAMESGKMEKFRQLLKFAQNSSVHLRKRRASDWNPVAATSSTLESLADDEEDPWENDDDDDDDDDEYEGDFEDPSEKEPSYLKSEQMAVLMAREERKFLSLMGHNFEDMVLSCTYRGVSCRNYTSKFWKHYWHYKYGNCYVFNSGKTDSGSDAPVFKSNKPGPSHGLTLELNVEQDEYIGALTPEAGIRMDISTQGEMPFPMERGVSLSPGYATMIGLRKEKIIREDPFGRKRCLQDVTKDAKSNLYTKHFGVVYSATACKESCLAYNQREGCGCMEYRFPGNDKRICNILDKSTMKCLSKVQRMFKENKLNCTYSCPPPCREEGFKKSTSFAIWPSEKHEPFYTASLEKENKFLLTKDGSHRKNVCKVQVFYEELNLEVITEQRSYELEDFVSDIGGQLGLWIGFSVLTVAEFLELFMLLLHVVIKNCKVNRMPEQGHEPEQRI